MKQEKKAALITGASSGLGAEFARLFASDGVSLVLTSSPRSESALSELAGELRRSFGIEVFTLSVDLAREGAADEIRAYVRQQNIDIDYLVNNAGYGIVGLKMQDYDRETFLSMLRVNMMALSELTMLFLPGMVSRKRGAILNVSSIAGYVVPHGLEAGYAASKAYVVSLSEALADDLAGTGVTCTHLAPGPTRTNFFSTAGLENDRRLKSLYMSAPEVALAGYKAMKAGKPAVIPGLGNKFMTWAARLSPSRKLVARLSGRIVSRE
ncbi:MAG TPA: SDR family oxidoreductase [Solimonas sp.]|nr:SDR family oxidoreductase [Solimonas sp.]